MEELGQSEPKVANYLSYELRERSKLKHDVFCALCGTQRSVMVDSGTLNGKQHLQVVLASIFIAWALFPLIGAISLFLYPFVWMAAEFGKKSIYRKGAQCPHCGFDAVTYVKDVSKAKNQVQNHLQQLPKQVIFKRGYGRKIQESDD